MAQADLVWKCRSLEVIGIDLGTADSYAGNSLLLGSTFQDLHSIWRKRHSFAECGIKPSCCAGQSTLSLEVAYIRGGAIEVVQNEAGWSPSACSWRSQISNRYCFIVFLFESSKGLGVHALHVGLGRTFPRKVGLLANWQDANVACKLLD